MALSSRRRLWVFAIAGILLIFAILHFARRGSGFQLMTADVVRGPLNATVSATGTVNPVITVHVGSQISGTVAHLYADYNSQVKAGQVLAQLDPAIYNAQLAQAVANLEKARVAVEDAHRSYDRSKELLAQNFIAKADRDAAETAYRSAITSARQAEAAVKLARVNLDHCTITSPIAGIVISRAVDVGQTVAASLQAPDIFIIANDLSRMQVETAIDEADIGKVQLDQPVSFTVDAFPDNSFLGRVTQIRAQPVTVQNVVTYTTVIETANPDQKLRPGMTANVTILVAHRDDVIKVPNAALRFKPPTELAARLGLKKEDLQPQGRGGMGGGATASAADFGTGRADSSSAGAWRGRHRAGIAGDSAAAPAGATQPGVAVSGGAGGPSPGGGPGGRHRLGGAAAGGSGELRSFMMGPSGMRRAFKPPARVYVEVAPGKLKPATIRTGLSDGQYTELVEGSLQPGQKVATAIIVAGQSFQAPPPGMGGPFGGGGGRPGGGGGGGGGGRR